MFKSLYYSPWHIPFLSFVAIAIFLALVARKTPFLIAFSMLFGFELFADALLTGELKLLEGSTWLTPVAISFVVMGDWRYFILVERFAKGGHVERSAVRVFGISLAWALMVPIAQRGVAAFLPSDMRWTFLSYELLFLIVALILRVLVLPYRLRDIKDEYRSWLLKITLFEVVQYAGWALADVLCIYGTNGSVEQGGYALRLIPNLMYYAAFLPFVWQTAPAELKESLPAKQN